MRYFILGVTEARDATGGVLPLGGARLRALLAVLALRPGRPVPVGELVDGVWGADPPYDAGAALQALVGRLRRVLGKEAVDSDPGGYRLAAGPDDVDLYVFEKLAREGAAQLEADDPRAAARTLREALALWRGTALVDLPGGDHGVRPEAQRLAALQHRIEADLRCGVTHSLVPELKELTATRPYDEPFHALLIRALRAQGRQADALAAYERTRRTLADGLGVDPGPELVALQGQLLTATGPGPPPGGATGPVAPAAPAGNIRPRLTSFVGRERELAVIRADLDRSRLVTLTGPGGSGKTRLAEESAPPDAWLVELAPLDHESALPGAVLSALGLRETHLSTRDDRTSAQDNPTARLVDHLARRPMLLILDNCEHVIGAAAALAETLLTRCPGLRVLATSREPLGVPGEAVRPVEPLPRDTAHQLFAERARAVRPEFDPADDPAAVAEICRRLDGLPLAIELAAARLRLLTPRQIADRLDDRFRLLTSGSRTVLPRQQTLRAVVDWSWDLLDERERTVLRQVSVFAGGWDLTAAESVCGSADAEAAPGAVSAAVAAAPGSVTAASTVDVPGLLGALVDKSLVVAAPADAPAGGPGGEMRYRLLETIHEYAVERAAETPAVRAAAERLHTAYFTGLAEEAEPLLRSGEQLPWIRRLEADLDNIRAALHRTVTVTGDEDTALRIIFAVGWFWWLRNYRPEGLAWVERALKLGPDTTDPDDPRYWPRMHLLMMRLLLVVESDGTDKVRADPSFDGHVRRVTEAFSKPGPQGARFPGLLWGIVGHFHDETMDMRTQMDASLANCRVYGGDWEVAVLLMGRTHVLVDAPGGMADVDEGLAELHQLTGRVGDRWVRAQVASAVAEAAMARGQYDAAEESYRQALRFAREVGAHAEAPFLLARLAELAFRAGDTATAARGLDEAWAEAERHDVQDTRAFVLVMRAVIALDRSEYARAREALDGAYRAAERGTPPPQFQLVLDGVQARISAHEAAGPAAAVRSLAAVLRRAMGSGLATGIVGSWAEMSAPVLLLAGRPADAVRVLAAVEEQAGDVPRSAPEKRAAEQVEAEARAELGPARFAAERAAGGGLTFEQIAELLEAPADRSSGASVSGS